MPTIDQFRTESDVASEPIRHTASPESVGASVTTWLAGIHLDLSRPATYVVTLVGAFALGLILVTIALAFVSPAR